MKTYTDWTGHTTERAQEGEKIVRSRDWTGHAIVSTQPDRRRDWQQWIGPGILAIVVTYLCGVWYFSILVGRWCGEGWEWIEPLVMFTFVIPVPAASIMILFATAEQGVMTPLGYWRWLRALKWGPSTDDGSSSDTWSSDYDSSTSSDGHFGGGGSFGGGGGGASW